jgi:hypothetical protein
MRSPSSPLAAWCAAFAIALTCSACSTLATNPAATTPALAGDWQQDPAASEDFDSKLMAVLKAQRERMRPRHNRGGMPDGRGGSGAGPGSEFDPLMLPPDEPEKVRSRLAGGLRPPAELHIALNAEGVEITADAEPARQYLTGQSVSRIDTSGAATVDSGWDQNAFVVRAKYTNRSSRSWRYDIEPANGMLRLDFETDDPEFGNFKLLTRYRRAAGISP